MYIVGIQTHGYAIYVNDYAYEILTHGCITIVTFGLKQCFPWIIADLVWLFNTNRSRCE